MVVQKNMLNKVIIKNRIDFVSHSYYIIMDIKEPEKICKKKKSCESLG